MEEKKLTLLKKELKLKEFQFNSIFEFSESIYSSFSVDNIFRIYFSTIMGQFGISRAFLYAGKHGLFRKRGFVMSDEEYEAFCSYFSRFDSSWLHLEVENLSDDFAPLRTLLQEKKIQYLINLSDSGSVNNILGMGARINKTELSHENIEYAYLVSRFSLSAIDNAYLINELIESKRLEHEIKIARDIQLSLLPQTIPQLNNFEIAVMYQPINEVGGDYYDILKEHKSMLPVLIADVEGKGLSAALLAASSQAIFHSLNQLYFFEPGKFVSKANSLIYDFTHGTRFITLCWMLLDDKNRAITYVNAGHVNPFLISRKNDDIVYLNKGGFLTGFMEDVQYEKETLELSSGDIIVAYTDGVLEVSNPAGQEFGEERVIEYVKENKHLQAEDLVVGLAKTITLFSEKKKFSDDFTLMMIKVK